MNNIFILSEHLTNGYEPLIFNVMPLIASFFGISVIINKNPIVSVLFLIGLFLSMSSFFFLLGLNFIGLSYLLVYVGAVSILFLFILMLIDIRSADLFSNTSKSVPLAIMIGIAFSLPLLSINIYNEKLANKDYTIINSLNNFEQANINKEQKTKLISLVTDLTWEGNLVEFPHISGIGNILYTNYYMWFIIASLILLLAMVGTIVITIKPNKNP